MTATLRDHLDTLRSHGLLLDVDGPVDLRYASAVIARAGKAVHFHRPQGYGAQSLVGGIYAGRELTALAYGCPYEDAWKRVAWARQNGVKPVLADHRIAWDEVTGGDGVDLSELPIPVLATQDGAPYISAAITGSLDPDGRNNWGVYRYQLVNRNTLAIDLTTQNNMHNNLKRAYAEGRSFGVTVNLSNHPYEFLAAAMDLPAGVDEMEVAGALHGEPVELVAGQAVQANGIATSEYILEGEFLPGGWTHDEGRFGEFHGLMGSMHKNPALRIHRVMRRRDAHLYTLQMAHEINHMHIPITEMFARQALRAAGIEPVAINVSMGGCTAFHIIASIKKFPGAGKNAILALMNVGIVKHVVVVDDDIDVFNLQEVEWAIATRVQAEKDVIVIPGMGRAKPLDPVIPPGMEPMLIARLGIDATMPEGIPRSRYERIEYPHLNRVTLEQLVAGVGAALSGDEVEAVRDVDAVTREVERFFREQQPVHYFDVLTAFAHFPHRAVVQAMGRLDEAGRLCRDERGHYLLRDGAA